MFGSITLKVRPLRLAFLVDPKNSRSIREAIQINSTLWGGSYNPIIPIYSRMPQAWGDKPLPAPKAETVIKGYIDAFDPDILIQYTKELPDYIINLGLKIIKPSEIWEHIRKDKDELGPKFGIGIFELLNLIFNKHFKYKERFPIKIVIPQIPKTNALFWSSLFGEIPRHILDIIDENYKEALDIEKIKIKTSKIKDLLKGSILFPRRITQYNLDAFNRSGFRKDACVFFMDTNKYSDIIDYWNLRALGRQVVPIPKGLKDDQELKDVVINFLRSSRKPWKHNPQVYDYASFIRSRNVSMEEMEGYAKSLGINKPNEHYYALQHWYPRIWDEWARDKDAAEPDDIFGDEKTIEFNDVKRRVQFSTVLPEFVFKHAGYGEPRCANEINFRFYGEDEFLAQVFPKSNGDNFIRAISSLASFRGNWRVGRNGLVRLVKYDHTEHWDIPLAQDVFFSCLKDVGWEAQLSTPGLITKQIFTQLEGMVRPLANEDLLGLFEHMNGGPINERELSVGEVKNKLKQISPRRNLHDYLISKNVFRIGAKIQCPHCLRNSWYSLNDIKEQLACPKCLNSYPAIGNIDDNVWCYKTAGPFSIPGYADGGYCVSLAIDNFSEHRLHSLRITPSFSFTAKDSNGNDLEADFGALWQESTFKGVTEGIMFGECKTFGVFEKKDFQRMRGIAKQFPGAVLVFCTLRKELNKDEIKEIAKIAKAGRKHWKSEKPINPVLILTGNEILSDWGPPQCWEGMELSKKFDNLYGLLDICNATQQIYLNLPSWHDFWHEEFEKRRSNKIQRMRKGMANK